MANSDNPTSADLVTVDPNFSLPSGVVGMDYINLDNVELDEATVDYDVFDDSGLGDENEDPLGDIEIRPPDWISVVSQVMRQASDGRYVVDVIIDVEELPNVTKYEVGLTKA